MLSRFRRRTRRLLEADLDLPDRCGAFRERLPIVALAACTGCTTASARCGSMTTRISTSPCSRVCSIAGVAAMKPWVTRYCYQPARFRVGLQMSSCPPIRSGSVTTPVASVDLSETEWTRRSRACSFTPLARSRRTPTEWIGRGVHPRHSSSVGPRRYSKPRGNFD